MGREGKIVEKCLLYASRNLEGFFPLTAYFKISLKKLNNYLKKMKKLALVRRRKSHLTVKTNSSGSSPLNEETDNVKE